jgi:hypothetical protein
MGAARFAAATQARGRVDETLGLERSRRVKELSELNAKWASEVGAQREQLHKESARGADGSAGDEPCGRGDDVAQTAVRRAR